MQRALTQSSWRSLSNLVRGEGSLGIIAKMTLMTGITLAIALGVHKLGLLAAVFFIGGVLAWMLSNKTKESKNKEKSANAGLLLASGLITGEALMGIFIAIAIAGFGFEKLAGYEAPFVYENIGLLILIGILIFIYRQVVKVSKEN